MSSAKPTRSGLLGIIDHVKTKDAHAFPGGVASMWRRNVISGTRDWEADAVEVAERTAWASCLLKGHTPRSKAYASAVSPVPKFSSCQMDSHWLGHSSGTAARHTQLSSTCRSESRVRYQLKRQVSSSLICSLSSASFSPRAGYHSSHIRNVRHRSA